MSGRYMHILPPYALKNVPYCIYVKSDGQINFMNGLERREILKSIGSNGCNGCEGRQRCTIPYTCIVTG